MESFFRCIAYVDYYKDGEKLRNVGFLRWKLHKNIHSIEIQVKDVGNFAGKYEIQEKNTQKVIGKIILDKGIGSYREKYTSMSASGEKYIETCDDRLYLCDIEGFVIRLNEYEYMEVNIELEQKTADETDIKQKVKNILDETKKNSNTEIIKKEESSPVEEKNIRDIEIASENVLIEGITEKYDEQKKQISSGESIEKEKYIDSNSKKEIKIIEPLHEDKWQQLCKNYPKVHPFHDNKIFLSVKPEDFIILQQEYQKLVQNSFLLHGFYNYGHLILGKLAQEEEGPVYIGVPGVYYEREKQAARMFGFVGFESTEHPVQAGSYGYYMIEVKL